MIGALLIVDVQDRLMVAIPDRERLIWNIQRLLQAAQIVSVPRLATEQNPERLGPHRLHTYSVSFGDFTEADL